MGTRARNKFTCIIDEPFISFVIFSISSFFFSFGIRGLIFLCVIFFYTLLLKFYRISIYVFLHFFFLHTNSDKHEYYI